MIEANKKLSGVVVRKARMDRGDLAHAIGMARSLFDWAKLESAGAVFDAKSVGSVLARLIESDSSAVFIAEHNNEKAGFVAVMKAPALYNTAQMVVQELAWWIEPKFRNGSVIKQMSSAIKNWAANQGIPWMHVHIMASDKKRYSMRLIKGGKA